MAVTTVLATMLGMATSTISTAVARTRVRTVVLAVACIALSTSWRWSPTVAAGHTAIVLEMIPVAGSLLMGWWIHMLLLL